MKQNRSLNIYISEIDDDTSIKIVKKIQKLGIHNASISLSVDEEEVQILQDNGLIPDTVGLGEETLLKAADAMAELVGRTTANDLIRVLLNAGILLRERL